MLRISQRISSLKTQTSGSEEKVSLQVIFQRDFCLISIVFNCKCKCLLKNLQSIGKLNKEPTEKARRRCHKDLKPLKYRNNKRLILVINNILLLLHKMTKSLCYLNLINSKKFLNNFSFPLSRSLTFYFYSF